MQYFSTFIAGFFIAFFYNWKLTLVVGTMLPVVSFLVGLMAKVTHWGSREGESYVYIKISCM